MKIVASYMIQLQFGVGYPDACIGPKGDGK